MNIKQLVLNQLWEQKYEMLQALVGLEINEIRTKGKGNHWPIGWIVEHCICVMDLMINKHITGNWCLTHKESLMRWPLLEPDDTYIYYSSDDLQRKWINSLEITINNINSADESDFQNYSPTGYGKETLLESCLRVINHNNAHLRNIWCQIGLVGNISKWPEQGIWMPKNKVYDAINNELDEELPKLSNSQSVFVRKVAKKYYKDVMNHDSWTIIEFCEDLVSTKNIWLQMIAYDWINRSLTRFTEKDFFHFERWLKNYIEGWGSCDDFCKRILNPLIETYDKLYPIVVSWTKSENMWVRRASLVGFIKSSNNRYTATYNHQKIFQIAELLLNDKEKYVQKGIGWLLKATSLIHKEEVIEFLKVHQKDMSRLSFIYAIENLPEATQQMLKRR
jgi:3-methyladenine DNA glycosylase AlkD